MNRKTFFWFVLFTILLYSACSKRQSDLQSDQHSILQFDRYIEQIYNDEEDFEVRIGRDYNGNRYIEITKYIGKKKTVIIPPQIQNMSVKVIGQKAFMNDQLVNIIIPNTVDTIRDYAFAENNLTSLMIPDSVRYINDRAFYKNYITSLIIPDTVVYIGKYAFALNKLTSVTIPDSFHIINNGVFYGNQLTNIVIPKEVRHIEDEAFAYNQITSIIIPDEVRHIRKRAFYSNNITSVTFPDILDTIGESAFTQNKLSSITISAKVRLDYYAFDDNEFIDFYQDNGSRPGVFTLNDGRWNGIFIEEKLIGPEVNGIYKIVNAYSNLYNDHAMYEVETQKLGIKVIIDNYNKNAIFDDEEYELFDSKFEHYGKYGLVDYGHFLNFPIGMNFGSFDINIIGKDYNSKVKIMSIKNDFNDYTMYFADNKLIIEVRVDLHETEFKHIYKSTSDSFYYIAEKIIE
jgi:hypothetical protein